MGEQANIQQNFRQEEADPINLDHLGIGCFFRNLYHVSTDNDCRALSKVVIIRARNI